MKYIAKDCSRDKLEETLNKLGAKPVLSDPQHRVRSIAEQRGVAHKTYHEPRTI